MASHHDALWAKLHELEQQLAAYKLLRTPRAEDVGTDTSARATEATCRGRQYDAYMHRRNAKREAASAEQQQQPVKKTKQPQAATARGMRAAGGSKPMMSPRVLRCTARDTQEVKKTPTVSIPSTPRREAGALPRSRTVNGVGAAATGSPARPHHLHQRRSSLGAPAEFASDSATTPRPFLKRGTGTGGAAAPARLRTPRVQDIDVLGTPRLPHHHAHAHAARHARSVSELPPFDAAAALASPATQARASRRWDSPERPAAMVSPAAAATDSHRDFSKGLKKLLSFVRKGGKGSGDADPPCPSTGGGKSGKPVMSKGWSGTGRVAALDLPFDRANLDGHRFPMTRTVGISG